MLVGTIASVPPLSLTGSFGDDPAALARLPFINLKRS
jgi:hypothetical protein